MFKRLVVLITMISVSNIFFNSLPRAGALTPLAAAKATAKKKGCLPCSAAAQGDNPLEQLDSLATLGRRTQSLPFAPLSRSVFEGAIVNMVSTATGHLGFYVTDLSISGTLPIKFQRIYASDRNMDTGLGNGWSFAFDDRIMVNGNTAKLSAGTGSTFSFSRDGTGQRFVLKTDEPNAHQSFTIADSDTITEQAVGLTRTYKRLNGVYRLSQIADANGNKVTIGFDGRGNISRIANDGGALALEWSDGRDARLLSVTDNAGGRVSFRQDGQRLRAVTDSYGAQLTYDYEDGRLLTRAADPVGRTLLRVRYDKSGRVLAAGDAAGTYLYQYDTSYGISRRTVVTDPAGVKTVYEQTERGLLASAGDGEVETARIEYNAANRPARLSDSEGNEIRFAYDAQNRLLHQSATDGTDISYTFDEKGQVSSVTNGGDRIDYARDSRGNIIAAKNSDPAKSYSATLDGRGLTVYVKSEKGREVSLEYDASGNETAFALPNFGRFQTERDATGRIRVERLPSGLVQSYEYDSRGKVLKQSDNRGHSLTIERDASGAMVGLAWAGGGWVRATRDDAGRIVAISNSSGKSRRFTYDARGALLDYADASGRHKRLEYDQRGRVHDITDNDGNKTVIERDRSGRPQRVSFSDGTGLRYEYDRAGSLLSVKLEEARKGASLQLDGFSLNHPSARSTAAHVQESGWDCFFGYDGFYDGWTQDSWMTDASLSGTGSDSFGFTALLQPGGCSDPFGGLGGCDWYGGFDSWYASDPLSSLSCSSYAGETCLACIMRQIDICITQMGACIARPLITGLRNAAPCLLAGIVTGGLALLVCLSIDAAATGLDSIPCREDYKACLLSRQDQCPQCRK
ncbi:MAG: DUF6531 domain-containing protein [Acidobacteriota bacterium]|nr:DUF6531 domain-containing protein [Acidobacteriota bacterium]